MLLESLRRLRGVDKCPTVILSFPRSGNHAVRYFLESVSGRPTLSAIDHESFSFPRGLHDLPVLLRSDAAVRAAEPIAIKRHKLKSNDNFTKLIYLERPVVEAVLSQGRLLNDEAFFDYAPGAIQWWFSLHEIFDSWSPRDRFRLRYADIRGGNVSEFEKLAAFLEIESKMAKEFFERTSINRARGVLGRAPGADSYERIFPERAKRVRSLIDDLDDRPV